MQPIKAVDRFHADWATLAFRNVPIALGLFAITTLLDARDRPPAIGAFVQALPFFCLQMACVEMLVVTACVATGLFQGWRLLVPGLIAASIGFASWHSPLFGAAVGLAIPPMGAVEIWIDEAIRPPSGSSGYPVMYLPWGLVSLALYFAAGVAHVKLRDRLRHRVVERTAAAVPTFVPFASLLTRRFGPSLVAQIRRDWRLTLRGFSPAAGFCIAAGALPHFAAWAYFAQNGADAETVHIAAQSASALSSAALASVAFFLLSYELHYFWPEKTAASSLDTIWQSKVGFALLVAAPGAILAALWGAALHPGTAGDRALTALAALAIGPIVASFMGMLSFEVANRPGLGVLLSALVAVGAAVITAIKPAFWLLLIFFYGQGMHGLAMRAKERVRFTEIER